LIDFSFIVNNGLFPWNMIELIPTSGDRFDLGLWRSLSSRATVDVLREHFNKPWDWRYVDAEVVFNGNFYIDYPNLDYDYYSLSEYVPIEYALENKTRQWNWYYYSSIASEVDVSDNPDVNWVFSEIRFKLCKDSLEKIIRCPSINIFDLTKIVPYDLLNMYVGYNWDYEEVLMRYETPLWFVNENANRFILWNNFTSACIKRYNHVKHFFH